MIIPNAQGQMVDLTTGEIVGREEGAPITAPVRAPTPGEVPVPEGDRVMGLAKNLSWGFNSMLFAAPDLATEGIGKAMGMNPEEVFTLGKFFNKGQVAPRNAEERFSRAIGEGIGAGAPITGTLAYFARIRPMAAVAETSAGVLKGIANDAIKFAQQSPYLAAGLDIAFGAGFETLRQAVKENISDDNPNKALYESLLPTAAFVGLPLAVNIMPSVIGAKAVANKVKSATANLGQIESDVLEGLGPVYRIPGVKIVPKLLMKNAERKLEQVFGPISKSPEAQQAIKQLEIAMQDPRFAEAGFMFDAAETTMYGPLLARKAELLEQLGPTELEATKKHINENQQKLAALFDTLAPEARQPVIEAFQAAQADRQAFFESLLKSQKDLTEAEVLSVSERLGPQNMDMINNELRGALLGAMEFDASMRTNTLNRMGLRQAVSPDGLPMPTRQEGKSLFPARDMEEMANSLIAKYTPERPSLRNPIPEPIALLRNFVQSQQLARDQLERKMVKQLLDQAVDTQLAALNLPEGFPEAVRSSAFALLEGKAAKGGKKRATAMDVAKTDAQGFVNIPTNIRNQYVRINPNQIKQDAARIAGDSTSIDINAPEALDYLAAAARYRNDSLARYNAAMSRGTSRLTDAQRILDTGNAVYKDVEKLILDHVPKIKTEYEGMKNVLSDYRAGFEKNLPLLMSQTRAGGEEFLLGNEQLMQRAFQNAGNLRQLQVSLGGTPQFDTLLVKGTMDWLRNKNVVTSDGIVDPKKIRAVLDKNRNIVEALPPSIQGALKDEVALADEYITRLGELDQRRVTAKNDELDQLLRRAGRPDADPRQTLAKAIQDPSIMRVLVDEFGKDPERLAALRRSVFEVASEGSNKGGALQTFLQNNEKSLSILFKDTTHLNDLKTLADLQARVNAFADVTGQIPAFDSLNQTLKNTFGAGIEFLSTTARETAVGRISPSTGALAILVRFFGRLENDLYNRIFIKALEDKEFAKSITHVATPADAKRLTGQLQAIGIPVAKYLPFPVKGAVLEAGQLARDGEQVPIEGMAEQPVMPRETARQMMRKMPPAPPTTGTNFGMPTIDPRQQQQPNIPLMYPTLFPNDPISAMLLQRQQQIQQGQPITPGQ